MRMHVPVLAVDFPEIRRIVAHYGTGTLVNHCEPQFLAETIKQMLAQGKNEAGFAAANAELSWENESETLLKVIRKALKKPEKEMEKSVKLSYRRSMDEKRIHIIAFNIPYPANYGGVIDVFYKLKALSGNGVKITLHVFEYGRKPSLELEKHCEKVYYYKRKTGIFSQLSGLPYIVYSRRSKELLANLLKDNSPILFEGLHCCYCLNHPLLKNRLKMVRAHNIESVYYRGLAQNTTSLLLKLYFSWEARKLEKFEPVLSQANYILTLSTTEKIYFETKFGKDKTVYIPLFFQNQLVDSNMQPEIKPFVLYHGDLSTPENRKAVAFLIHSVASKDKNIPWIFAGLNPRKNLLKLAESHKNVTVIANLSEEKMSQLIQEASVNILFTHQVSGVKVKLLHALANGRHCLANKETVKSSGLEKLCRIISNRPDEILETIRECLQKPIPETEITRRKTVFYQIYDNNLNALKINKLLKISPI
jgi:glycosyltransferase involved in cell wall biosynthesis